MPTFGMCGSPASSSAFKAAGWAYVEGSIQALLQGTMNDAAWTGRAEIAASVLPVPAANMLVPGNLKVTGPDADLSKLERYMTNVLRRAGQTGVKTLVFGSGVARAIPDGFDRGRAKEQILAYLRASVPLAAKAGVTIVAEPLNRVECNVMNSVAECMTYVKAIEHPNFQCLVDSYHFWLEDEPLENLRAAMPWIKHVHLADKVGRVAPGLSGQSDYRSFFKVLKDANYQGLISYEGSPIPDFDVTAPKILDYVRREWDAA